MMLLSSTRWTPLQSPTPQHRAGLHSFEFELLLGAESLPGFQDWIVMLCELISCFAIAISFFRAVDDDGDRWLNTKFLLSSLSSLWMGSAVIVLLPRACASCCGWSLRLLRHPLFPASVQIMKLMLFGAVFCRLTLDESPDGTRTLEVKRNEDVVASVILAACDVLVSLNTIRSTFCGEDLEYTTRTARKEQSERVDYPRARRSRTWIFVNLWKDFGVLSTVIKLTDSFLLALLILNIPTSVLAAKRLVKREITSQQWRYHLYRYTLMYSSGLGMYLGSLPFSYWGRSYFEFVDDLTVPVFLLGCEVIPAICEMRNGGATAAETTATAGAAPSPPPSS